MCLQDIKIEKLETLKGKAGIKNNNKRATSYCEQQTKLWPIDVLSFL